MFVVKSTNDVDHHRQGIQKKIHFSDGWEARWKRDNAFVVFEREKKSDLFFMHIQGYLVLLADQNFPNTKCFTNTCC